MNTVRAYVGLGGNMDSNFGEPLATLRAAMEALRGLPQSHFIAASSFYQSAPLGLKNQPDFINAAAAIDTQLTARALLDALLAIEARFGRRRNFRNAPRTLDLDLLLYGEAQLQEEGLNVPHPRMQERAFVLEPLLEITPSIVIPGLGSATSWLAQCADQKLARLELV